MTEDLLYRISELERRLANVVRVGVIDSVDHSSLRARVRIGSLLSAPLRWTVERAGDDREWWSPSVGEQVIVLAPFGDLSMGFIQRSLYQDSIAPPSFSGDMHRTEYADGSVVEYDKAAHQMRIATGLTSLTMNRSSATISCNGSFITLDSGGVAINGTVIDLN